MAGTLSTLSVVSFIAAGVALAAAVFLWFYFKIPTVIGDLSGRNAKRSIARMREANEKNSGRAAAGKPAAKTAPEKKAPEKRAPDKRPPVSAVPVGAGAEETTPLDLPGSGSEATELLSSDGSAETVMLDTDGSAETAMLSENTAPRPAQPAQPAAQPAQPAAQPVQPAARPAQPEARPAQPAARPVQPAAYAAPPAYPTADLLNDVGETTLLDQNSPVRRPYAVQMTITDDVMLIHTSEVIE